MASARWKTRQLYRKLTKAQEQLLGPEGIAVTESYTRVFTLVDAHASRADWWCHMLLTCTPGSSTCRMRPLLARRTELS